MSDTEVKDIWDWEDASKRNEICYTQESIRHPAKMHLPMCREIIKRYSNKGDLILDCMAGIGSTIVEGMMLGRNVIGIEYEQKFVDMAVKNIELTKSKMGFLKGLGNGQIIKGDSRELTKLLGNHLIVNQVVFSPPFSSVTMEKKPSDNWKGPDFSGQVYSENKEDKGQIGNLDYHGAVSSVIFSPPYSSVNQADGVFTKHKEDCKCNFCKTHKQNTASRVVGQRYSDDKNNIGNLPHGQVDSVITSPPYGHESTTTRESLHNPRDIHASRFNETNYSDDPANCRNLQDINYLTEMLKIYQQCFLVLKDGGFMVLVLKNFVRGGVQVRLDLDTIKLCESAGFVFLTRHYRKIKNPSFWITNAIQKWEKKHPDKPHPYPLAEDILVFKKSNTNTQRERERG